MNYRLEGSPGPSGVEDPEWVSEIAIQRGGTNSHEAVLFNSTSHEHLALLVRVASAWVSAYEDDERPWMAFALSAAAHKGVLEYFKEAPGYDEEHDAKMFPVLTALPLDRCHLTGVQVSDPHQEFLVQLTTHPPAYGSPEIQAAASRVKESGFSCNDPERDDGFLFTEVHYATGETGQEQVLGWDDVYSDTEWEFLGEAATVFVDLRPDVEDLSDDRLRDLVGCFPAAQRDVDAFYRELPNEDDLEEEDFTPLEPRATRQRCPSSGENVGRMIEIPGMDDWRIECPTCGAMWAGGSTTLSEHDRRR